MIVTMAELADAGARRVGGKAWNLGRLAVAGERVPVCFAIPIPESELFFEFSGVKPFVASGRDSAGLSRLIRERYEEAYVGYGRLHDILRAGFDAEPRLRGLPLAVRSSASFEDSDAFSSAGQHDTFLGVSGAAEAARAVALCWASQWTERAITYRSARGLKGDAPGMGVVVQGLVPADKSGVLFTRDPTRRDGCLLVEATPGRGDPLVSGRVIPERVRVERSSGLVIERGGVAGEAEVLSDAETDALAKMGLRIEELFGAPQDIEWAFEGARLYVLQARPITAFAPVGSEAEE